MFKQGFELTLSCHQVLFERKILIIKNFSHSINHKIGKPFDASQNVPLFIKLFKA